MPGPERSVLHVLPHPGGGGETYVDLTVGDRTAGVIRGGSRSSVTVNDMRLLLRCSCL